MSAANPCTAPVARSCARSVLARRGGSTLPAGLLRLYRSTDGLRTVKGGITWDGTPSIGADGVDPGHGPTAAAVNLGGGKVVAVKVKMDKASDGLTGDEQIFGPIYARNGYIVVKSDLHEGVLAHSWVANDEIRVCAHISPSGVTVRPVEVDNG